MSVAVRHLAHRITSTDLFDDCQQAFIAVLDALLATSKQQLRVLHIATLDMAKAFNTVSHYALAAVIRDRGLPADLMNYVESIYSSASTVQTRFVGE